MGQSSKTKHPSTREFKHKQDGVEFYHERHEAHERDWDAECEPHWQTLILPARRLGNLDGRAGPGKKPARRQVMRRPENKIFWERKLFYPLMARLLGDAFREHNKS